MIIWLTWRIAAGKGVIVQILEEKWFTYHTISQIIRDEAKKKSISIKRKNLQDLWNKYREEYWNNIWIKKLIEKIDWWWNHIIDWIRNVWEIKELRKLNNFYLISVDADQETRFKRVLSRWKDSDPKDWNWFLSIDDRDFYENDPSWQQVGKCMKLADFSIENNWDLDSLKEKVESYFEKIIK